MFGKIEFFVCMQSSDDWCIVASCLQTIDFNVHYHSYSVQYVCPKVYKVVTFDSLVE